MVERKFRWNVVTDIGEQIRMRHRYTVAILNEPREITRITQRLLEQIAHVDDFFLLGEFSIPGSNGLHCEIFSFSSDVVEIPNPDRIYRGHFRRDRDLYERKGNDWEAYVDRLVA